VNSTWAIFKERTWKVNEDGGQDVPLLFSLVSVEVDKAKDLWLNALLAAIRHTFFDGVSLKSYGRELAFERLHQMSERDW
jgi:hypothetical protein